MNPLRLVAYTVLTMLAFSANSLLCRLALKETSIDAASYTTVRILSAAAMLWLLMRWQARSPLKYGSWRSTLALFVYATTLSFAYRSIAAGAGALMLVGAVQVTMMSAGFIAGESMNRLQSVGFAAAMAGLLVLVLPGVETPSVLDSVLMLASGIAISLTLKSRATASSRSISGSAIKTACSARRSRAIGRLSRD